MSSSLGRIADTRLLLPVILVCASLVGAPMIVGAILSFGPSEGTGGSWTLDGYRQLMAGGRLTEFTGIVVRSLGVTVATMVLAVPSAYWLARLVNPLWRSVAFAVLVAPWFISDMLRAFGWQLLLSPAGPVSGIWTGLTGSLPLEGLRYNRVAVLVGIVSSMLPAGILSVYAALPGGNRSEWNAAEEIGPTRHVFRLMAIGWANLGIVIGTGIVFILSCYASAEPRFLDGPTQSSIGTIAASLVNTGVPALLAFSTVLLGFMVVSGGGFVWMYYLVLRVFRRRAVRMGSTSSAISSKRRILRVSSVGRISDAAARFGPSLAAAISILMCCAPVVAVAVEAFWQPGGGGHWTFDNFPLMWRSASLREALLNSVLLATAVTLCVSVLGFFLSLVVWNLRFRVPVILLLAVLMIMPGDAYALSLVQGLRVFFGDVEGGWLPLILAHVLWALPIATASLILANIRINPNVMEAALEYARSPFEVLRRMLVAMNRNKMVGVALIGCTLSLNEGVRSAYLSGGLVTIGNEVHGRLTAGMLPENRGVFAAEFLVFVVSVSTLVLLARSKALDPSGD